MIKRKGWVVRKVIQTPGWQQKLLDMQDQGYREFQSKLMPGVPKETVIGVRIPQLRAFAREFSECEDARLFLQTLPHRFYEENNLHMMLIAMIQDYAECLLQLKRFLPYVDNWSTCDLPIPKCFYPNRERLLPEICLWLCSEHTYTIRYGIGLLMRLYLDENFSPEYPALVAGIVSEEYYVNMMAAWYFAEALAKQWDAAVPYLAGHRLSERVHGKAIQKAVESRKITAEQKEYLKSLR